VQEEEFPGKDVFLVKLVNVLRPKREEFLKREESPRKESSVEKPERELLFVDQEAKFSEVPVKKSRPLVKLKQN
jgi:hypothetical protein